MGLISELHHNDQIIGKVYIQKKNEDLTYNF